MSYEKVAREDRCARPLRQAGRAVDVSSAAAPEAASATRSAVVDALTGHVDGRVLAKAEFDGRTRVWVELVCWPSPRAPLDVRTPVRTVRR